MAASVEFPQSLDQAIAQAKQATVQALESGQTRLQVELEIPEISLQSQPIAWSFTEVFGDSLEGLRVLFPDTGAAALARRDWGEIPFAVSDLGSRQTDIDSRIQVQDSAFLVVGPSSVEVDRVERLCELAGDRPVVLLIPQLEDLKVVGLGYTARQLRERFLNTLETSYCIKPLEGATILRYYPHPWQVWIEREEGYELFSEEPQRPTGDLLDRILTQAAGESQDAEGSSTGGPQKPGLLGSLQRFVRALTQ
jgi:hypothetical protein